MHLNFVTEKIYFKRLSIHYDIVITFIDECLSYCCYIPFVMYLNFVTEKSASKDSIFIMTLLLH